MACVFAFGLQSCNDKKDTLNLDYHYNYFPLDSGKFVIYDVDSVTYLNTNVRDSVKYQLMEIVGDTFYDNQNELSRKVWLYRRANNSSPWVFDRLWFAKATVTNAQKIEDDVRFIKLIFPPAANKKWKGNVYVAVTGALEAYQDWDYKYLDVFTSYSTNGFSFDSTLTVSAVDEENVIEKKLRKEVYAKGVGMIYQEYEILQKQPSADWITGPTSGFRIRMKISEHN